MCLKLIKRKDSYKIIEYNYKNKTIFIQFMIFKVQKFQINKIQYNDSRQQPGFTLFFLAQIIKLLLKTEFKQQDKNSIELMSVIFNNTFTADKPIYYPSNWKSGKTGQQLYNEFKATFEFFMIRNLLEIVLSTAWVFLIYTLILGAKQLYRISCLDDQNPQKIRNKQYIDSTFIMGVGMFATVLIMISIIILMRDWGLFVLAKGVIALFLIIMFKSQIVSIFNKFCHILVKVLAKKPKKRLHEQLAQQ